MRCAKGPGKVQQAVVWVFLRPLGTWAGPPPPLLGFQTRTVFLTGPVVVGRISGYLARVSIVAWWVPVVLDPKGGHWLSWGCPLACRHSLRQPLHRYTCPRSLGEICWLVLLTRRSKRLPKATPPMNSSCPRWGSRMPQEEAVWRLRHVRAKNELRKTLCSFEGRVHV